MTRSPLFRVAFAFGTGIVGFPTRLQTFNCKMSKSVVLSGAHSSLGWEYLLRFRVRINRI
jgi:hypothetical protein